MLSGFPPQPPEFAETPSGKSGKGAHGCGPEFNSSGKPQVLVLSTHQGAPWLRLATAIATQPVPGSPGPRPSQAAAALAREAWALWARRGLGLEALKKKRFGTSCGLHRFFFLVGSFSRTPFCTHLFNIQGWKHTKIASKPFPRQTGTLRMWCFNVPRVLKSLPSKKAHSCCQWFPFLDPATKVEWLGNKMNWTAETCFFPIPKSTRAVCHSSGAIVTAKPRRAQPLTGTEAWGRNSSLGKELHKLTSSGVCLCPKGAAKPPTKSTDGLDQYGSHVAVPAARMLEG